MDDERDDLPESEERSSRPAPQGQRRFRRGRSRRPRSGDVFLVVLAFGLVVLFFSFEPYGILSMLYNPIAGLILLIVVVEYLVLKSMDRTRIYQLENRRLREYRRGDRVLLKRTRDAITESLAMNEDTPEEARLRWRAKAQNLLEDIRDRL